MEPVFSADPFVIKGWSLQSTAGLPKNKLNDGVQYYLTYENRLSLRYYPGFIRLTIRGNGDERCFQIEFGNDPDPVVSYIIDHQNDFSLDSYFTHYLAIQGICSVSILAIEQFL